MQSDSLQPEFLLLGRELEAILQANGLTIRKILEAEGLSNVKLVNDPGALGGTRDIATIMMASAAILAAATPLIVNSFKAIINRPVIVKELELVAALDGNGHAVKSADGNPVLIWREKSVLHEPQQQPSPGVEVRGYGFEIKLG